MLKQQGPQNWQPYQRHHAPSISSDNFVLPPTVMIDMVRFGHVTLSCKDTINSNCNSKNMVLAQQPAHEMQT